MTGDVALRRADAGDAPAIAEIAVRTWIHAYSDFIDPRTLAERTVASQTADWERRLSADATETVVAEVAGRVAGYATTGPAGDADSAPDTGFIFALYVDPSAQGAGLGTQLLTDAVARLRATGYRDATLWAFAEYGLARRFYEGHGWTLDPSGTGLEDPSWREPSVRYRLALAG